MGENSHAQEVIAIKAAVEICKIAQSPNEQAGPDKQNKCERHLRSDESLLARPASPWSRSCPPAGLQGLHWLYTSALQSWSQTKNDSSQDCDCTAKQEN